jgi:hypothetical protein
MSKLCRLKTNSHGEEGKWAYNEIINLRNQVSTLLRDNALLRKELADATNLGRDGVKEVER